MYIMPLLSQTLYMYRIWLILNAVWKTLGRLEDV